MYSSAIYYEILGLDPGATESDVKRAYRRLAMRWHPDRHQGESREEQEYAAEKFRQVKEAYDAIMNGTFEEEHGPESYSYSYYDHEESSDAGYDYSAYEKDEAYRQYEDVSVSGLLYHVFELIVSIVKLAVKVLGTCLLVALGIAMVAAIIYAGIHVVIFVFKAVVFLIKIAIPVAIIIGLAYLFI